MHPTGIIANLPVADLAEAREFYVEFFGLGDEGFNLRWVMRPEQPRTRDRRGFRQVRSAMAWMRSSIAVRC
jgi:hypothetical protein